MRQRCEREIVWVEKREREGGGGREVSLHATSPPPLTRLPPHLHQLDEDATVRTAIRMSDQNVHITTRWFPPAI